MLNSSATLARIYSDETTELIRRPISTELLHQRRFVGVDCRGGDAALSATKWLRSRTGFSISNRNQEVAYEQ
jgi:hypothetical protein